MVCHIAEFTSSLTSRPACRGLLRESLPKAWIGFVVDEDDYTPSSCLPDEESFKDVERLQLRCMACDTENNFHVDFHVCKDLATGTLEDSRTVVHDITVFDLSS